jgi:MoaA/NifB/PqqE/SkfB family radical SAM enzyme
MKLPPDFLFIDINKRCNLKCQHCLYWEKDDSDKENYISIQRRNEIIDEFSEMAQGKGTVVICGGESMLDRDEYFAVSKHCANHNLNCFSVINGSNVKREETADRMIMEGPTAITVSLNSHIEEIHDRTRGLKGSHRMAVNALQLLLAARDRHASTKKIYAMAVICEQNYRMLEEFYDFVLNYIKADKLKLNFLQPTFGSEHVDFIDKFYAENIIKNYDDLVDILNSCNSKYKLNLNPAWVEVVRMYHRSVNRNNNALQGWRGSKSTEQHICNSYERNIMVNHYGHARLCFSPRFPAYKLVQHGDLKYFWEKSDMFRASMKKCNAYCGISHSVRKESATLKQERKIEVGEIIG